MLGIQILHQQEQQLVVARTAEATGIKCPLEILLRRERGKDELELMAIGRERRN